MDNQTFLNMVYDHDKKRLKRKETFKADWDALSDFASPFPIEEKAFLILHDLTKPPTCKCCGEKVMFRNTRRGYSIYCSKSCKSKDNNPSQAKDDKEITKENVIDTFYENGKIIPSKTSKAYIIRNGWKDLLSYYKDSESVAETIYRLSNDITEKPRCKTCGKTLRYSKQNGFSTFCSQKCASNDEDVKNKNKEAVSKALTEKYRTHGEEIKNKRRMTLSKRYNVASTSSPFSIPEIRRTVGRSRTTSIERLVAKELDEMGIGYIRHDRSRTYPLEIDILTKDIGIECDGFYWHKGDTGRDRHLEKYKRCQENGIRLLCLWEDVIRDTNRLKYIMRNIFQDETLRKVEHLEITKEQDKYILKDNGEVIAWYVLATSEIIMLDKRYSLKSLVDVLKGNGAVEKLVAMDSFQRLIYDDILYGEVSPYEFGISLKRKRCGAEEDVYFTCWEAFSKTFHTKFE